MKPILILLFTFYTFTASAQQTNIESLLNQKVNSGYGFENFNKDLRIICNHYNFDETDLSILRLVPFKFMNKREFTYKELLDSFKKYKTTNNYRLHRKTNELALATITTNNIDSVFQIVNELQMPESTALKSMALEKLKTCKQISFKEVFASHLSIKKKNTCTLPTESSKNNSSYANILHAPYGIQGYFDIMDGIAQGRKENKPILLYFTGHGNIKSREMESEVWANEDILKILKDKYVITFLYVDDKHPLMEKHVITNEYGKAIRQIGKKNAHLQLNMFKVKVQPAYYIMDANEKILLDPLYYTLSKEEFKKFLTNGLSEYEKRLK
jgi:hypothetical protein